MNASERNNRKLARAWLCLLTKPLIFFSIFCIYFSPSTAVAQVDTSVSIWEQAGQANFTIRPQSNARYCVANVQNSFEAIDFGRSRGQNFITGGIGFADGGRRNNAFSSHMQGIARLPDGWLVQSHTKGVFLTHFPSKDGSGHSVWTSRTDRGYPTIPPYLNPITRFNEPRISPDRPRLDWCRDWGTNCGRPAADRFCQIKGFTGSTDFKKKTNVDFVTEVLVGGRRCDGSRGYCDSFKEIECVLAGGLNRKHVGGVHAYHNFVVIPSDKRIEIFSNDGGRLRILSTFDISQYQPAAHYASILPLVNGDWLLAVGRDGRKKRSPHRIHFYVIPNLSADQGQLRYLGRWGRGKTRDDFQSASLIAGCDGGIFIIGTGVKVVQSNEHAKLYQVLSFTRSSGRRPSVEVNKIKERSPGSQRNDCSLNAAATFFPTSDRALAMYCTEKEIRNGQITTREYHDE